MHRNQSGRAMNYSLTLTLLGSVLTFVGTPACGSENELALEGGERLIVHERQQISADHDRFDGWGTVHRGSDGRLYVAYSGNREGHVCPYGRVELITSDDDGYTWSEPTVIAETPVDDRDSAIIETPEGTLLASWFTSVSWMDRVMDVKAEFTEEDAPLDPGYYAPPFTRQMLDRWLERREAVPPKWADAAHVGWLARSEDGGQTWSQPYSVPVNSPHGPIVLEDERLLFVGKRSGVGYAYASSDDGRTWQHVGTIPAREGDNEALYHEYHVVEAADGSLVAQLRNHNDRDDRYILQTVSHDGGRTWSEPASIGLWGFPTHLLRMAEDRLLMTYGYRRDPRGVRIAISDDHGETWSEPAAVYDGGDFWDLGYPSTVQIEGNEFLTVWYEASADRPFEAKLYQARWELAE